MSEINGIVPFKLFVNYAPSIRSIGTLLRHPVQLNQAALKNDHANLSHSLHPGILPTPWHRVEADGIADST